MLSSAVSYCAVLTCVVLCSFEFGCVLLPWECSVDSCCDLFVYRCGVMWCRVVSCSVGLCCAALCCDVLKCIVLAVLCCAACVAQRYAVLR